MLWDGSPHIDPITGETTPLPFAGDPVTGEGWIDPIDEPSGDRRIFLSSGPFVFAPGDTQEVIVAIMAAQGTDPIDSIVRLRELSRGVQTLFENWSDYQRGAQITIPRPPAPAVEVAELAGRVVLSWDDEAESYVALQPRRSAEEVIPGYRFEGYNVYQLDAPEAERATFIRRMATFDLPNGVQKIRDLAFVPSIGQEVEMTVQWGTDSGLRHFLVIEEDSLLKQPLINGQRYYFGVSSYAYNPVRSGSLLPHALESPIRVVEAMPHEPLPGTALPYGVLDTVAFVGPQGSRNAEHIGNSQGSVVALAIDPMAIPTADYEVTFEDVAGQIVWNLSREGVRLLTAQRNQSGDWNYPIVDGLLVKVMGPPFAFAFNEHNEAAGIVEVSYGGSPIPPGGWDRAGEPFGGNCVWRSVNWSGPTRDHDRFFVSGGTTGRLSDLTRSIRNAVPHDFEFRLTERGSYGWWKFEGNLAAWVPFELWDIGVATPDDPADDRQLIPILHSGGHTVGIFDISQATPDPRSGFPATDRVFFYDDPRGYQAFAADAQDGAIEDPTFGRTELIADMILVDFDEDGRLPPPGTVIRFNTTKPNLPEDRFVLHTQGVEYRKDLAKQEIERITVFPNPYYARNRQDVGSTDRYVIFSHLPERATIRIFTLAGDLVRKLEHNDTSTFEEWDLRNEAGATVASGIYIVHIEMPELGEKILKLAIFQPVEIPEYYTPTQWPSP